VVCLAFSAANFLLIDFLRLFPGLSKGLYRCLFNSRLVGNFSGVNYDWWQWNFLAVYFGRVLTVWQWANQNTLSQFLRCMDGLACVSSASMFLFTWVLRLRHPVC